MDRRISKRTKGLGLNDPKVLAMESDVGNAVIEKSGLLRGFGSLGIHEFGSHSEM